MGEFVRDHGPGNLWDAISEEDFHDLIALAMRGLAALKTPDEVREYLGAFRP